ncbi:choice-of-anchor M domain-containing protein [Streptomyces sp. NPDC047515]|uniref:choice-of-anchor M domain-containing protein n=1 Tax=Streptomyces sp. NPDC047515 TaxID=3155380 RepID=UPI0033CD42F2
MGTAGSTVFRLPQVQNTNLLWPGLSGEHLTSGVFQNNKVQVKLVSVSGPGKITVYKDGLCPKSNRSCDSGDATLTNVKDIAAGEHDHANWVFTKAGTYTATFQVSGHARERHQGRPGLCDVHLQGRFLTLRPQRPSDSVPGGGSASSRPAPRHGRGPLIPRSKETPRMRASLSRNTSRAAALTAVLSLLAAAPVALAADAPPREAPPANEPF